MATDELAKELQLQLESDILYYGWIRQVARDCGITGEITSAVRTAILKLLKEGAAEIGDAKQVGGRMEFYAWSGTLEEIASRLDEVIDRVGERPRLYEGFWLAKLIAH